MKMVRIGLACAGLAILAALASMFANYQTQASVSEVEPIGPQRIWERGFDVEILVNGRALEEYSARGKNYVEAIEGAEYEVRVRNPLPYRVAVSLSVDGLNTIDARRTSAWNASKWVIEPYGTISVGGWQMSSERARRFYFTSERDSYGAKLGQTSNLGVISAVFFRERRPTVIPIAPPPKSSRNESERGRDDMSNAPTAGTSSESSAKQRQGQIAPMPIPDDDYAATGIGRSVRNDVRWVNMELDSRAAGEVSMRYEYYPALVRLGVLPRRTYRHDSLGRREGATGFEDRRFSPEP